MGKNTASAICKRPYLEEHLENIAEVQLSWSNKTKSKSN